MAHIFLLQEEKKEIATHMSETLRLSVTVSEVETFTAHVLNGGTRYAIIADVKARPNFVRNLKSFLEASNRKSWAILPMLKGVVDSCCALTVPADHLQAALDAIKDFDWQQSEIPAESAQAA
jgi:hypothetical protein